MTDNSIYGDDPGLRQWLEAHDQPYALAVSGKEAVWLEGRQQRITGWLDTLPT